MCRMAYEEVPAPLPANKRAKGRPRTSSQSTVHSFREEDEEDEENRLRGASSLLQLASASTTDLSVLADVALKMDPDPADSEETETSDEAEEHKMEDPYSRESLAVVMSPEGVVVLIEHSYCKPPHTAPALKRTSKQESVLLPADLNAISGVLEAPEEVIDEAPKGDAVKDSTSSTAVQPVEVAPSQKKKSGKSFEQEKSKKRKKDKENVEVYHAKKQKDPPRKKQRKRKLEVCGFYCKCAHYVCVRVSFVGICHNDFDTSGSGSTCD